MSLGHHPSSRQQAYRGDGGAVPHGQPQPHGAAPPYQTAAHGPQQQCHQAPVAVGGAYRPSSSSSGKPPASQALALGATVASIYGRSIGQREAAELIEAMAGEGADDSDITDGMPSGTVVANRWALGRVLGSGGFGVVYEAADMADPQRARVAIKMEKGRHRVKSLQHEWAVFAALNGGPGIPPMLWSGSATADSAAAGAGASSTSSSSGSSTTVVVPPHNNNNNNNNGNGAGDDGSKKRVDVLVMPLLGKSLYDVMHSSKHKRFSVVSVMRLARRILRYLEHIHNCGWLHRDIKPHNFLFDKDKNGLYIVDFGLAKRWCDPRTGVHITDKRRHNQTSVPGTAKYASLHTHNGNVQSRRDDLESLAYTLVQLARGSLPWDSITCRNKAERCARIHRRKAEVSVERICRRLPPCFASFLDYARKLTFYETPNYEYCRALFTVPTNTKQQGS